MSVTIAGVLTCEEREALERCEEAINAAKRCSTIGYFASIICTALRRLEALAVPAQAPVAWMLCRKRDGFIRGCYSDEPSADQYEFAALDGDEYRALYTHPQPCADVSEAMVSREDLDTLKALALGSVSGRAHSALNRAITALTKDHP